LYKLIFNGKTVLLTIKQKMIRYNFIDVKRQLHVSVTTMIAILRLYTKDSKKAISPTAIDI